MNSKFYQSIDNIHGTIYYTQLEKVIVNTPFFHRLHDVNQSSTVYLTFPTNRTKRYEHSLGTMQVTSDIFYNAAINSSGDAALETLMKHADTEFTKIINFIGGDGNTKGFIFLFDQEIVTVFDAIRRDDLKEGIENIINQEFLGFFSDNCLLNMVPRCISDGYQTFLFICLLQAFRLVSLLHDVGHPPQSHIIESVLGEVCDVLNDKPQGQRTIRQNKFVKILAAYQNLNDESIKQIDEKMAILTENCKLEHLHEMVGVQVIKNIVDKVFSGEIKKCIKTGETANNKVSALYYLTIIEFIFAMVRNKNAFWSGLHSIIDGVVDTDRLDFVQRDANNSGMTWGKVPYKRLINTVKFCVINKESDEERIRESVQVCFSAKNVPEMDNLLRNRYKIFTLINYHHRSTKVSALYQRAVKSLILHYLESESPDIKGEIYFSNISGLWRALEIVYANDSSVLNLIQWNDSWLNGLLNKCLIEGCATPSKNKHLYECCECLKEIFLNERKHMSLIKRKTELLEINNAAKSQMKSLLEKMEKEIVEVNNEIKDTEKKQENRTRDSSVEEKLKKKKEALDFLQKLHDPLIDFDWKEIETNLGNNVFTDAMERIKETHPEIDSYFIEKVGFSLGTTGQAYVYDYNGESDDYYVHSDIKNNLEIARRGFPYHYIYINYKNFDELDNAAFSKLRKEIGEEIGKMIVVMVEETIQFEKSTKN